jgi:hypothetical protein
LAIRLDGPTKIGIESDHCQGCGHIFRTPDKEWIHMTLSEHIGHFCAPWTAAVITMAGVVGFTVGLLEYNSRAQGVFGAFKGLGIVCLLLIPYWLFKLVEVRDSLRGTKLNNPTRRMAK